MHTRFLFLAATLLSAAAAVRAGGNRLAPIAQSDAVSTHGPYEMGACETCHERHDAKNPGSALKVSNELCFECHDEFKGKAAIKMEKTVHPAVNSTCTVCHNPHNSRKKKLRL